MLKLAKQNVARALSKKKAAELKKEGFVPMGPQGATAPPPMDPMAAGAPPPAAGGGMPMDPSMGGAPPPAGGMPMDPAMGGGAPPPMDPAAGGGAPPVDPTTGAPMDPAGGAPPPGQPVMVSLDDLIQLFAMVQEGGMPGGEAPGGGEEAPAPNEAEKPKGGRSTADAIDEMSGKLDQLIEILGGAAGGGMPPGAEGAMPPPEAMAMGGPAGIQAGEPLPEPEVPGGAIPEGMPPGPVAPMSGMIAQASADTVESRARETLKDATPEPEPKQAAAPKQEPAPKLTQKKASNKHALKIHRLIQGLERKG